MEPGLFSYIYDNSIMTRKLISLFHYVQTGTHLIMGPMTTHEMRNDEEDDCVMLTTLIAVDEGSQLSKSGMSCLIFFSTITFYISILVSFYLLILLLLSLFIIAISFTPTASGSHSFTKKKKNTFVYKNSLENTLLYNGNPSNMRTRTRRKLRTNER